MNLIPIIYNSLMIFGGLFAIIITTSYIAAKLRKNKLNQNRTIESIPQSVKLNHQVKPRTVEEHRERQIEELPNLKKFIATTSSEKVRNEPTVKKVETHYERPTRTESRKPVTNRYSIVKSNYEDSFEQPTYKKSYAGSMYFEVSDKKLLSLYSDY